MNKIILYFFISIVTFSTNNISTKKLDITTKNSVKYITLDSLNRVGIIIKRQKIFFYLKTDIGTYFLTNNRIITPNKQYPYISTPFITHNKHYVPLNIILELSGLSIKKNSIIKSVEPINSVKNVKIRKRFISLSPSITEKFFDLGGQDLLVGRTYYAKYPKGTSKIDVIGTMLYPNIELIINKSPDVVITETRFSKRKMKLLNNFGIKTVRYKNPKSIEDIYANILNLGILLNRHMEARGLIASLKESINFKKNILKNRTPPTVYYALGSGKVDLTSGGDTFINSIIELAGGKNIAKDKKGWRYSLEELILHNPDIIFGSKNSINKMLKDEKYHYLSAIRNKKYYIIYDENRINLPGPYALTEGLDEMIKIFHPELKIELKQ